MRGKLLNKAIRKYQSSPITVKASFWFLFCNIMQKGLAMLTVPIVTRMLSTTEYGIYSVFISYSDILVIFGTLRLFGNGYFVGMKRYEKDKERYTSSVGGLMILVTSLLFALYWGLRNQVLAYTGLGTITCVLIFIWVYTQGAIGLWFVENRYEFKYRRIVICTLFMAISTPVLKVVLIPLFGRLGIDKSIAAILGLVLPNCVIAIIAWGSVFIKGKCFCNKGYWKFGLTFNIPLIPFYLSTVILNQADRIMIERLDSAASAGIYSVAYTLAMGITVMNHAAESTLTPWIFKKMERGEQGKIASVMNVVMVAFAAVHIMLIAVAPEILKVFAATEYAAAMNVIPPVTIGAFLLWITSQLFTNIEFYYEKNKLAAVSSIVAAAINIVMNAITIPVFGYYAAGYTTLICYFLNLVFHCVVVTKLLKMAKVSYPFDIKVIALLTAGSILLMLLLLFLYPYIWIRWGLLLLAVIVVMLKYRKIKSMLGQIKTTIRTD